MHKKSLIENRCFACFAAVFCTLLWGTAFPFIKLGYAQYEITGENIGGKLLFAGFRFFLAGIMVYVYSCIRQKRLIHLQRNSLKGVLNVGVIQTAGQYMFSYIGIGFTSSANTSIINSFASFISVLAAPLVFRDDKLTAAKAFGCAAGLAGVLVVNAGGGVHIEGIFGDFCIVISTVFAASGNLISKKYAQKINPVELTAFQLMLGGGLLIVFGVLFGGDFNIASLGGALILLWLALVSAVAFSIWTVLLKYHPASRIVIFNLLVPIFGTVLSGVLLGEAVFRAEILISLVLISVGIFAVNSNIRFRKK